WHAWTSNGCPPTTRVVLTWPSGLMTTSIFTLPATFIRRASSGETGETLVLTFRLDSSVEPDWPNETPEIMARAPAAAATRFHLLNLIDTSPLRSRNTPARERHVRCHASANQMGPCP